MVVRPSQAVLPFVLMRGEPASLPAFQPLHSPQPKLPTVQQSPPPVWRSNRLADPLGNVLIQAVTQLTYLIAAQYAAQITAFSTMLLRFEEMRVASPPNLPMPSHLPSVLSAHAYANLSAFRFSFPSGITFIYQSLRQVYAYATLLVALSPRPQPQPSASPIAPTSSTVVTLSAAKSMPSL